MIRIRYITDIIYGPSFITAGLMTHDLIYEKVYRFAKLLE